MTDQRWEFRCWPRTLLGYDRDLRAKYAFAGAETRTDRYFLVPGRRNVMPKLRGGERLEVKVQRRVRRSLQLWEMVLSAGFPLHKEDMAILSLHLSGQVPSLSAGASPQAVSAELAYATEVFDVQKQRILYDRAGLTAELCIAASGARWACSLAFECEEAGPVVAELERIGLQGFPNLSYADALQDPDILGQPAARSWRG
jgi:hypothetical protein